MTDNANNPATDITPIDETTIVNPETAPEHLLIKIGTTVITADQSMVGMTTDELRESLKFQYPEVVHATVREAVDSETNTRTIHYLARPGRKG